MQKIWIQGLKLTITLHHSSKCICTLYFYSPSITTMFKPVPTLFNRWLITLKKNNSNSTATNELSHKTKPLLSCFRSDHIKYTHFALKADLGADHACSSALETKSEAVGRADPGEAALFWLRCFCRRRDGYYKLCKWCNVGEMSLLLWFTCLEFLDYLLKIINSWKKKKKQTGG